MKKSTKVSEHYIIQGLKRSQNVKSEVMRIKTLISKHGYSLQGYRVVYDFSAILVIKGIKWDKEEILKYPIKLYNIEDTIIPSFGDCDTEDLYYVICSKILSVLNYEDIRFLSKILRVDFEDLSIRFNNDCTIIWTTREVGIYHTEQECGEGWIMLPQKPIAEFKCFTNFKY